MSEQPPAQQNPRRNETPAQRKLRMNQQYKQAAEQQRKRWTPLLKYMKKHNIKFKTARCHNSRIEYFRTDELEALINKNRSTLENDDVLKNLISTWSKDVIYFQRPQTSQKLKYPKELQKTQNNIASKFASFKFHSSQQKTWIFPLIVGTVIACVLFPLWPYTLKYIVFMILLTFVITIISIIIIRLVVYMLFAVFGVSLWIFPQFFGDVSFIDSFRPFYSVKKWQGEGVFNTIGRLLAFSILAYYAYHAYIDPSWIYQNIQITKTSMEDLHDWGANYIKGEKNFSQSALTNLDHIMNQTADINVDESRDSAENSQNLENQQTENTQNSEQTHHEDEQGFEESEEKQSETNQEAGDSL